MELEKQVCSLELAKRLKELGVKQESRFWWHNERENVIYSPSGEMPDFHVGRGNFGKEPDITFSAFTVAELGEILHRTFSHMKINRTVIIDPRGRWKRLVMAVNQMEEEADSRAKMLIYLLDKKLM